MLAVRKAAVTRMAAVYAFSEAEEADGLSVASATGPSSGTT